jgi:hypothetical protein
MSERTELQRAAKNLYDDLEYTMRHLQALRGAGATVVAHRLERDIERCMETVATLMHEEDCDE